MDDGYQSSAMPAKSRSLRSLLLIVLISAALGVGLMGWGLSRWQAARDYLFGVEAPASAISTGPDATGDAPTVRALTVPPPALGVTDERLAELEAQVAQLSRSSSAQSGNSDRAEGLLLAFAARRALDRGIALGYVEGQLNMHFGQAQPRAVAMIIAAARQPVTLDQLKSGLDTITPQLIGEGPDSGWWESIKASLASLIIVRDARTPSPAPAERLARARSAVDVGRVDQALAEVARLPNRDAATAWMAMARRHIEAYRALDLIEAAAIIGPTEPPATPALILPEPGANIVAPAPKPQPEASF